MWHFLPCTTFSLVVHDYDLCLINKYGHSCTKLLFAIASKHKSRVPSSSASRPSTSSTKEKHHMHIMFNMWRTFSPLDN
ncbi:hypothetical protein EUGRSUZ_L03316 [Eucalyptus grandis]|uniref:Uncharacterized protein n=1 Tax=Eucalyptus grandis TaxID=71139 RepID=A0AAD9WGQ2_EUCGR|nr:hypothetical protein EUGRSUZ_L03316 [Eucalyptus grandis]